VLDVCPVKVGDFTLFGPSVQILTPMHPLNAELRRQQEFGKPISIGSDASAPFPWEALWRTGFTSWRGAKSKFCMRCNQEADRTLTSEH
jgi:hypothetical protein